MSWLFYADKKGLRTSVTFWIVEVFWASLSLKELIWGITIWLHLHFPVTNIAKPPPPHSVGLRTLVNIIKIKWYNAQNNHLDLQRNIFKNLP